MAFTLAALVGAAASVGIIFAYLQLACQQSIPLSQASCFFSVGHGTSAHNVSINLFT